jgi:hypothetical protein
VMRSTRRGFNHNEQLFMDRLTAKAREWGGDIRATSANFLANNRVHKWRMNRATMKDGLLEIPMDVPPISIAPTSNALALDWEKKIVYYVPRMIEAWDVGFLIHEMGHIFATTDDVKNSVEEDWLGWGYLLAKEVRGIRIWRRVLDGYALWAGEALPETFTESRAWKKVYVDGDDAIDVGALNREAFHMLMKNRISVATKLGCVKRGKAIAVR